MCKDEEICKLTKELRTVEERWEERLKLETERLQKKLRDSEGKIVGLVC
jgi:hypothetical protein